MKKRAFYKDVFRTLRNNLSRFIAIVVMTALGTGVFTGFAAGCMDVFDSADHFFDQQKTYDIKMVSTLGLTEEDLSAVSALEPVRSVFGNCSMDVTMEQQDGNQLLANVTTLDPNGMNAPYVLEGTLPTKSGQIAVNSKFLRDTGLKVGDTVTLEQVSEDADTEDEINSDKNANSGAAKASEALTKKQGNKAEDTDPQNTATQDLVNLDDSDTELDLESSLESDTTKPTLEITDYEITAVILDPLDISNTGGTFAAVAASSSSTAYMLYVTRECVQSDVYTAIYVALKGAATLDCYSKEYRKLTKDMTSLIKNTLQSEREQARYEEVVGAATSKITVAEKVLSDKMAEAEQKFKEAQAKIDDGWSSYLEGMAKLEKNQIKLNDGQKTYNQAVIDTKQKLDAAQKELDRNSKELEAAEVKLNNQEADTLEKFAAYELQLDDREKELNRQKTAADQQLTDAVTVLPAQTLELWNNEATQKVWSDMIADGAAAAPYIIATQQGEEPTQEVTDTYNTAMIKLQSDTQALAICFASKGYPLSEEQLKGFSGLAVTLGTINYSQSLLEDNKAALSSQKSDALKQISNARIKIEDGKSKLKDGQKELDHKKEAAETEFAHQQAKLTEGFQKLEAGKKDLETAAEDLTKGQEEIDQNRSDYENSIATAKQKLSDAREDIAGINMTKWYVWDRSENDSIDGLYNDVSFIQAVTQAFPIIFFLVAILVCLTTMTRMVEEDRTLIGTYKSLGYSKHQISLKYILYAVLACVVGGILGTGIGFIGLPKVITIIVKTMYVLPSIQLSFYPVYGLGGFGVFLTGIVGATVLACVEMLHKRPAELMRPKAPKEGSRILLERIPFIWKRLKFLNKVTCRNLFRYKKRALMTIVGIAGCMMLIVLGFGVRDTVGGLMSDQYDHVTVYDAIIVTDDLDNEAMQAFQKELKATKMVKELQQLQLTNLTLSNSRDNIDIAVMVIPDDADLERYVHLKDTATGRKRTLPSDGIVVTQNAAKQLKLKNGDTVSLQNEDNLEYNFPVAFITANNAGNYVYVRESCYQSAFGNYSGTSLLLNLSASPKGEALLEQIKEDDRILSVNSSQNNRDTFADVKKIINMVVYLLISMSAVLALTVLFTLSNINVSERERELATIKVLGFKPKEINSYVNKETMILTLLGILLGIPAGYGITYAILSNVSIADITFHVRVSIGAYFTAAILTMIFTLLVNKITNRTLLKINMVEALKSVE